MRITGGALRSRAIVAPRGSATRPTSDRVREALFSILGGRVALQGARVLDLFAGSGALAFEALSRGAAAATLVERARPAVDAARANARTLGLDVRARLLAAPVERALRELVAAGDVFDVVFVDPPYADASAAAEALAKAGAHALLAEDGVLVFEHASRAPAPRIGGLAQYETRVYGDTGLAFFARGDGPAAPA